MHYFKENMSLCEKCILPSYNNHYQNGPTKWSTPNTVGYADIN